MKSVDSETERHEFQRTHGIPDSNDICGVRLAENNYNICSQPRSATVHQTEPRVCRSCGEAEMHKQTCPLTHRYDFRTRVIESDFAPLPSEPQSDPVSLAGNNDNPIVGGGCCSEAPPDQRVVPPRIWLSSRCLPGTVIRSVDPPESDDIEYRPIAPIQAAVEACDVITEGPFVRMLESDWNALVAAVKGEK